MRIFPPPLPPPLDATPVAAISELPFGCAKYGVNVNDFEKDLIFGTFKCSPICQASTAAEGS